MAGPLAQNVSSGSNSPKLIPARPTHLDVATEDEDYRLLQHNSDEDSDNTWSTRPGNNSTVLPEAALGPDETPDVTPPDPQEGMLPRDVQEKTAYYDYTSEKQLSQADAKLFYQRSKLDSQKTGENSWTASQWGTRQNSPNQSPVIVPKSMNNVLEGDPATVQSSASLASMQSARNVPQSSGKDKAAFPIGLSDHGKAPESNTMQEPSIGAILPSGPLSPRHRRASLLRADQAARDHSIHPELPHENKPLLEMEGLHGAGAGIGLGSGVGGFAHNDAHITSELSTIYSDIQKVLDIRHKYIRLSLQGDGDNPKDDSNWHIYPPPPEPAWHEESDRGNPTGMSSQGNSLANSVILSQERPRTRDGKGSGSSAVHTVQAPQTPKTARPRRKPGQDIGEDFYMEDILPVPGVDEMTFHLDANGVYQIYENSKSEQLDSPVINIPTIREFYIDLETILNVSSDGPTKSFAFRRLQYLEGPRRLLPSI